MYSQLFSLTGKAVSGWFVSKNSIRLPRLDFIPAPLNKFWLLLLKIKPLIKSLKLL